MNNVEKPLWVTQENNQAQSCEGETCRQADGPINRLNVCSGPQQGLGQR